MLKHIFLCIAFCFIYCGCSAKPEQKSLYPQISDRNQDRKSGPAMQLLEQAENDMDVNNGIIVIPPQKEDTQPPT